MRAKSNLARAKAGKIDPGILYEDICFDAQQAVEKALKSLCIAYSISFSKTHNISYLIELIQNAGIVVPDEVKDARILTNYAVETRYPGDYEPVNEYEYLKAVKIAEDVLNWVGMTIENE